MGGGVTSAILQPLFLLIHIGLGEAKPKRATAHENAVGQLCFRIRVCLRLIVEAVKRVIARQS